MGETDPEPVGRLAAVDPSLIYGAQRTILVPDGHGNNVPLSKGYRVLEDK